MRPWRPLKTLGTAASFFTNFVDFDSSYGHRRDAEGYGKGLMLIDSRLPELEARLTPGDLVLVTADHGCDPTFKGSDHTREHVPMLFLERGKTGPLAPMKTYSDGGQILAHHLGLTLNAGNFQEVMDL